MFKCKIKNNWNVNFKDTLHTFKQSFSKVFLTCMTVFLSW